MHADDPNFEVTELQARKKINGSKKHSNPDSLLKSSLSKKAQLERLPNVLSRQLNNSSSRHNLSSGNLPGLLHPPGAINYQTSKAVPLDGRTPLGPTLKHTDFNPPHLHTEDRFEEHNRETCEGCQRADRRKLEDEARERGQKSSSPKRGRVGLTSALRSQHRSPNRP